LLAQYILICVSQESGIRIKPKPFLDTIPIKRAGELPVVELGRISAIFRMEEGVPCSNSIQLVIVLHENLGLEVRGTLEVNLLLFLIRYCLAAIRFLTVGVKRLEFVPCLIFLIIKINPKMRPDPFVGKWK